MQFFSAINLNQASFADSIGSIDNLKLEELLLVEVESTCSNCFEFPKFRSRLSIRDFNELNTNGSFLVLSAT